jgi:hypothetical protein
VFGVGFPKGSTGCTQTGGFGGEFRAAVMNSLQVGDSFLEHVELEG